MEDVSGFYTLKTSSHCIRINKTTGLLIVLKRKSRLQLVKDFTYFSEATERYINGQREEVVCQLLKCSRKIIHLRVCSIQPQKHLQRYAEGERFCSGIDINRSGLRAPLGYLFLDGILYARDIGFECDMAECWRENLSRKKCVSLHTLVGSRLKTNEMLYLNICNLFLTFRFRLCSSPTELAKLFGPKMMRVLCGHCVHTKLCSPINIFRMFSAPVTRITGFPRR